MFQTENIASNISGAEWTGAKTEDNSCNLVFFSCHCDFAYFSPEHNTIISNELRVFYQYKVTIQQQTGLLQAAVLSYKDLITVCYLNVL